MINELNSVSRFLDAHDELNSRGIVLEILPGEYRVSRARGGDVAPYYTEDLIDALTVGRRMANEAQRERAPLGPCGPRQTRRGLMYRHNTMIAATRRAAGGDV